MTLLVKNLRPPQLLRILKLHHEKHLYLFSSIVFDQLCIELVTVDRNFAVAKLKTKFKA